MRPVKSAVLAMLGLALLWSASASGAPTIDTADGWYKWQVEGATATFFLYQENGKPTRIRYFSPDCRISWGRTNGISGEVVDMGSMSVDDSVAMLLDIAKEKGLDRDVREEALFGLAQSDSDTAYAYLDQLLFDN